MSAIARSWQRSWRVEAATGTFDESGTTDAVLPAGRAGNRGAGAPDRFAIVATRVNVLRLGCYFEYRVKNEAAVLTRAVKSIAPPIGRRIADLPAEVVRQLSAGEIETRTWTEWMGVDTEQLAQVVASELPP